MSRLALENAGDPRLTGANGAQIAIIKHDNGKAGVGHDIVGVAAGLRA